MNSRIRRPDNFLAAAGATAAETAIGNVIIAADRVLRERRPDALLLLGDTNSSLAAISAKRLKIPIFHMEAGNRCFDFRVPEEINRRMVDHIADINLPYSSIARITCCGTGFAGPDHHDRQPHAGSDRAQLGENTGLRRIDQAQAERATILSGELAP